MSAIIPESVIQLIRKVHELTVRGVGGEAENAKRKLDKLLAKHRVSLDVVLKDVVQTYEFQYRNQLDERLILQCYVSLELKDPQIFTYKKKGRKVLILGLDLTPAQYVDLKEMIAYYRGAWKKEQDRLFSAFVQRHKLYSPPNGKKESTMSAGEVAQIFAMMRGLNEKSFSKPAGYIEQ